MNKLVALFALYFAQGLPFGFQATALPLMLRERGASLATVGFSSLLAAPWLAKALWAPLVDRYGSRRFGRRKSWIVPMQAALALSAFWAARVEEAGPLAALILAMNFFAATQDIAVDALTVSWLKAEQLGPANALQVVGYKLGMLTGGGLLVWASARIGWSGMFQCIAGLMLLILLYALFVREPPGEEARAQNLRLTEIVSRLRATIQAKGTAALLAVVLTYKLGEALADGMWKPLLLDRGFSAAQIGLWAGTFGMACSLAGSALAGWAARRVALPSALVAIAFVRAAGIGGQWWISAAAEPAAASVIAVTCLEHFVGGAITTVLFALMMRHTDREIGATHYTLLASLEVWGKLPPAALSGVLATALGYPGLFALGTLLSVAFAGLARALAPRLAPA